MKRFTCALLIAVVLCPLMLLPVGANNLMQAVPWRDKMTGAALAIDVEHSMIHEGDTFTLHYDSDPADSNLIGEMTAIGFLTPATATGLIHVVIEVAADDESTFTLQEGPTVVANQGTALLAYNRYRDSGEIARITNQQTPAVGGGATSYNVAQSAAGDVEVGGTVLWTELLAAAAGPPLGSATNTASRGVREWILAADTDYTFVFTCGTNNQTLHHIGLTFYQHISSNY